LECLQIFIILVIFRFILVGGCNLEWTKHNAFPMISKIPKKDRPHETSQSDINIRPFSDISFLIVFHTLTNILYFSSLGGLIVNFNTMFKGITPYGRRTPIWYASK